MASKAIPVRMAGELVERVDAEAARRGLNRNACVVALLSEALGEQAPAPKARPAPPPKRTPAPAPRVEAAKAVLQQAEAKAAHLAAPPSRAGDEPSERQRIFRAATANLPNGPCVGPPGSRLKKVKTPKRR